jgi:hypothetical protein
MPVVFVEAVALPVTAPVCPSTAGGHLRPVKAGLAAVAENPATIKTIITKVTIVVFVIPLICSA